MAKKIESMRTDVVVAAARCPECHCLLPHGTRTDCCPLCVTDDEPLNASELRRDGGSAGLQGGAQRSH